MIAPLLERSIDAVLRRKPSTDSHRDQARETRVSLGLMAAAAGSDDPTDEQRLFLANSLAGMRAREAFLLTMPNRSREQEIELQMIRREMAAIEGRTAPPAPMPLGPRRFLAGPALGLLGGVRPWMLWTGALALLGGFSMIQTGRLALEQAAHQETRAEREMAERQRDEAREIAERMAAVAQEADAQSRQTAETIERERALRQRAEAEARRIRRARDQAVSGGPIDYGFGGVREPEAGPGDNRDPGGNPG